MQTLQVTEQVHCPEEGKMNGVAYDTAWVARVKNQQGKPLFPECVQWLLENQRLNGSWGSCVNHAQDHILSTLVSIIALSEMNKEKFKEMIHRGESYIWNHIDELGNENRRLAGIELIFPSLMEEAQERGLDLPFQKRKYEKEKKIKLKKIDASLWYSTSTTLPYSLEFLGDALDAEKAAGLLSENGSVFNSPSTTAYVLKHTGIPEAYAYLLRTLLHTGDGSIMTVHPFEIFESSWMLYNYMIGGMNAHTFYGKYLKYFQECMSLRGVGASVYFPLPDADDTALVATVLARQGIPVSPTVFESYYTGEHFVTYGFETESSVTTNLHILDFFKECNLQGQDVVERVVQFIKREMKYPGYWVDKWHSSVYYPTSHAVIALSNFDDALALKAVSWLLMTQHENGLWGYGRGTLEETALAVQALLYYHMHVEHIDVDVLERAVSYLRAADLRACPEFWVAKGLYVPTNIVKSTVVSALNMYRMVKRRSRDRR